MKILDHIWPWSEILRLKDTEQELRDRLIVEYHFGDCCIHYLDIFEPNLRHTRMDGKLYMLGEDSASVFETQVNLKPRVSFKLEGIEIPK